MGTLRNRLRRWRLRGRINERYYGWVLRSVPPHATTALDVGCGAGALAVQLAARGLTVDAVDIEPSLVTYARARHPDARVRWLVADALDATAGLCADGYDVVVAIASLHAHPSADVFARLRPLVAADGALLIVGLYRATSWRDTAMSAAALPLHLAWRAVVWTSARAGEGAAPPLPLARPLDDLQEIRRAAVEYLPGARVRRRLFWRFTLEWRAPAPLTRP